MPTKLKRQDKVCLMALETNANVIGLEGHSIMRPPLFNGDNYSYWKTRMRLFIQANDYEVWKIIVNGPLIPKKKVRDCIVPKEENEWDEQDTKMA